MMTREDLVAEFEAEDLDELVHDTKSQEANDINNSGIDAQIDYLLESGWTPDGIHDAIKNLDAKDYLMEPEDVTILAGTVPCGGEPE